MGGSVENQNQAPRPSIWSGVDGADWLLLLVPGLIWGASFLFIDEGMRSIGPNGVTFVRILIGFVTLSLFPAARKPVARSDWLGVAGVGVLWLAFPLSMFPFAEQHVSSALTGMLNGANPLFTAIVAAFIARRAPARRIVTGVAVGMAGAVLMAFPTIGEGHSSAAGVGMIMAALVSYGFALNIARPLQQRNGALPVIWRAQMIALVLTAPLRWDCPIYSPHTGVLAPWRRCSRWERWAREWRMWSCRWQRASWEQHELLAQLSSSPRWRLSWVSLSAAKKWLGFPSREAQCASAELGSCGAPRTLRFRRFFKAPEFKLSRLIRKSS
jgi:hypothetical protein